MSNFPTSLDDDTTLPAVNDNITEIGGDAINAVRDAVFAIESNLGLNLQGAEPDLATRLGVSIAADGYIKASSLTSLGLVTLPITNTQISDSAQIAEHKLNLTYSTQYLFNQIQEADVQINTANQWISATGVKLQPHLDGVIYRHDLSQIDVDFNPANYLKNKFNLLRNNSDSYQLIKDLNSEFLEHQFDDGFPVADIGNIITNGGSFYPSNYAHTSSGIYLNSSRFTLIPQTTQDIQALAEFIDSSSILLYGTRIQNLYTNGISRVSRSSSLTVDGYGQEILGATPAIAYLLDTGSASAPVDDIDHGDDIVEFTPLAADLSSNAFDAKFSLVKAGDILRINYGTIEVSFIIKEKRYIQNGGDKKFTVRIAGKNLFYTTNAMARIDRSLINDNKYGVLALAAANNAFSQPPSLIVGSPRSAQILGLGFDPESLDIEHYNLFLAFFPTGHPQDGYVILPAIDITGNQGTTSGLYTLNSVVESTNAAFRATGFNYRFMAFSYQGNFGIMLTDSYNNAGFSILNAVIDSNGNIDTNGTQVEFPNNVVDAININSDPLGFGVLGANVASPPYMSTYPSAEAAINATKLFVPLRRNNYYVNGVERERLNLDVDQILDGYGDGYWFAEIVGQNIFPGPSPVGRVETTYRINLDLSTSGLKIGKTIVVQGDGYGGTLVDFGRYFIENIVFNPCLPDVYTEITVYDAVHAVGFSPVATLGIGASVALYFGSDSLAFNNETATDFTVVSNFKRHFEVYIDSNGNTFTQERGRFNISGFNQVINGSIPLFTYSELSKFDVVAISPKLAGYTFGSVNKITLNMLSYNNTTGIYDGYLCSYDGTHCTHLGPTIFGKKGQITRFYDETNNDYIDVIFDANVVVGNFTNQILDFQLFPSLALDDEIMLIASCQVNDTAQFVNQLIDRRQFGNTSEKDLTTSALNYIALPEKLLHGNGVIRGFDLPGGTPAFIVGNQAPISGGQVLVNGKLIQINDGIFTIPFIQETYTSTLFSINWALCINDQGEYQPIPLLDFDFALNTPNNPTRVFQASNPLTSDTYFLDATTFSDLINSRKDLVPLYLISSEVFAGSPPTIDLLAEDLRRYVTDLDNNFPLILTTNKSQGNYKDLESIINWLRFNSSFNGNVILAGANTTNATIAEEVHFDYTSNVMFDGRNNATLTFNGPVTLGSNIYFKNMIINFNNLVTIATGAFNINFELCTINYTQPSGAVSGQYSFNFTNCLQVSFKDCIMTATYGTAFTNGAVFALNNTVGFKMDDTFITTTFATTAGSITPSDVFSLVNSPGTTITNSNFQGNFNKFLSNNISSGMILRNIVLTSSYNPYPVGAPSPDFNFTGTDLINTGNGWIYSNITGIMDGWEIDNITFNYSPTVASANRFSFINIELSAVTSILSNARITNCKFNDTNTGATFDGYRGAIAIINTTFPTASPNFQPFLVNVNISNNFCNRNQLFLITTKAAPDGYGGYTMFYPGLAAYDTVIANNLCGTIGYWISEGTKFSASYTLPNFNSFIDKTSGLSINDNTCHLIASMAHDGHYYMVSRCLFVGGSFTNTLNTSAYASGYVTIRDNTANWIHTGISLEEDSSLNISGNSLAAYDFGYLNVYGDNVTNSIAAAKNLNIVPGYNFAICVLSNIANPGAPFDVGNDSYCTIKDNDTSAGYWYSNNSLTFTVYNYSGYVYCQPSNNVSDNIFRGFSNTITPTSIYQYGVLVGGLNNIVTHNRIYKNGLAWGGYVSFVNVDTPAWDGSASRGLIVDNFFDSPYINDGSFDERVVNIYGSAVKRWVIERNINQTRMLALPMTNEQMADGYILGFQGNTDGYTTIAPNKAFASLAKSNVLQLYGDPVEVLGFNWQINLDKYMPSGARLVDVKMAVKPLSGDYTAASYVIMILNKYASGQDYLTLNFVSGADANILNDVNITVTPPPAPPSNTPYATINGSQLNASIGTASVLEINTTALPADLSDQFIANYQGYDPFGFGISVVANVDSTSDNTNIYFSPIMIKYRW